MTDQTSAGWYPAPQEPGLQRYWNGSGWDDERRPDAPSPATTASAHRSPSGLVIAGFVISVVALLLSFVGGGLIPGLVASIMLAISEKRGRTGLGSAGIALAAIAMVLSLVIAFAKVSSGG